MKRIMCVALLLCCFADNALAQRVESVPRAKTRPHKPSVDAPFLKASEATDQLRDNELVLGVVIDGLPRAALQQSLVFP